MPGSSPLLDPNDRRPKYQQVAEHLRRQISAGRIKQGDWLPTLQALTEQYGIAGNTAARAVRELEADGMVVSRGTLGREVNGKVVKPDKERIADLEEQVDHLNARLPEVEQVVRAAREAGGQRPGLAGEDGFSVHELNSQLDRLSKDVRSITERLGPPEVPQQDLAAEVAALRDAVAGLETRLMSLYHHVGRPYPHEAENDVSETGHRRRAAGD